MQEVKYKNDFQKEIKKLLSNRTSGAEKIASKEFSIIKKLYNSGFEEKHIKELVDKCTKQFPQMAPILKIEEFLSNISINLQNLTKLQNLISDKTYIEHSQFLFSKSVKILTFSNSSSIRNIINHYSDIVSKIFCCHSLPLGEGKILSEYFQKKSINSSLIEDSEISKHISKVDFVIIGTDAITKDFIINKVGTLQLVLLANYFHIPVYIIASKSKIVNTDRLNLTKLGDYFEKIENKLVTKIIT